MKSTNNNLTQELLDSNMHYCHVDFDGNYLYLSDLYVGYGSNVGDSLLRSVPSNKVEFVKSQLLKVKAGQTTHYFIDSVNLLGEKEAWEVWLQPGYNDSSKGPAYVEVYSRNLNNGSLNYISSLFKNFYTATDDILYILNDNLKVLDTNKGKRMNIVGNHFSQIVDDDDDYLFFLNNLEQAKRLGGVALKVTHPIYLGNNRTKKKYCKVSVTYMQPHGVGRYLIQVRDIHQEHTNRMTLKVQERQFEEFERWRSLGQMSAGIAHEINNPLCIIRIQAEQLRDRINDKVKGSEPAYIKKLDSIIKQVDRIENIANSLKIYSRSSNTVASSTHLLDELILDTLGLFQAQTGREIFINYKNSYKDFELECKKNEFYQILLNLLTNSYQAVHHYESLEKCWIKIWIERTVLGQYIIYVQDGGDGIKKSDKGDIFTPFFTTKEVGEGTGLGLSISKKLALENGMILDFEDDFESTTFSLTVGPVSTEPTA